MRYIIDEIVGISFSDKEEKRAESEISLYYFSEYRWEVKPSDLTGV